MRDALWTSVTGSDAMRASGELVVKTHLLRAFEDNPALHALTVRLRGLGPALLVGGMVRDWLLGRTPKDFDFVVASTEEGLAEVVRPLRPTRTRWGGFRARVGGQEVDIWPFYTTCTFKGLPPDCGVDIDRYLELVPFNVDAIAYDLDDHALLEDGFFKCFGGDGMLRRQFAWHPDPAYCRARARRFLEQYELKPSADVLHLLYDRETREGGDAP